MPRQLLPPANVDGALVRDVTDEVNVWVEIWTGTAWVRDTTTMIDEVMKGPTASPATLAKYCYPAK